MQHQPAQAQPRRRHPLRQTSRPLRSHPPHRRHRRMTANPAVLLRSSARACAICSPNGGCGPPSLTPRSGASLLLAPRRAGPAAGQASPKWGRHRAGAHPRSRRPRRGSGVGPARAQGPATAPPARLVDAVRGSVKPLPRASQAPSASASCQLQEALQAVASHYP
jgi:hypothetical protein